MDNFECTNRIADACGIAITGPVLNMMGRSADELNTRGYSSAKNTPGAYLGSV